MVLKRQIFFLFFYIPSNYLKNPTCFFASHRPTNRVSQYLHRAKLIDTIRFRLRSNPSLDRLPLNELALDSFVATNALRSCPSPELALSLFETLKTLPGFSHTTNTLHAMAKTLAIFNRWDDLQTLITAVDSGEYPNAVRFSSMDLLRWYAAAGDVESAVRIWSEMRTSAISPKKHPCTESYNVVMDLYAAKGYDLEAVGTFLQLIEEGANPNSRTYTVVIEHLAKAGRLDAAMEVFERLPSMRIKRTSKQFSVLAEGLVATERFDVMKVFIREMQSDGILPGPAMRLLLKKMRDNGFVAETEEFVKEFSPDDRIGNLGFCIDSSEQGDDDEIGGRLKPWLDPSAMASALSDWNPNEVKTLEDANLVWTTRLVCKLLRAFKRAETAWEFFCWVSYQPGGFTHDTYTVSRMLAILARHGHAELLHRVISKIKNEGIRLSFSTVRLVIDLLGISKKSDAAVRVFRDLDLICGPVSKSYLSLLYSSLLRTLIKCRRGSNAMDLLEEMTVSGILPDLQTYSGLMQHFALEGDLKAVHKIFGMMRQSGLEPDAYMFQILIRAYCKRERAALALRVFEDMRTANLVPDSSTKNLLMKSLWKEEKMREAASVEERSEEFKDALPMALPGHVWTVNSTDLRRIYYIYYWCFTKNGG